MRAILFSCFLGAAELIAAQSLPSCAQTCVAQTKVKCKASDFICACLSEKYVNKLATCFWKTCNEADNHDAVWYLISLCSSSGVVLQKAEPSSPSSSDSNNDGGNDFFAAQPIRLELRDTHPIFEERQFSFSNPNPGPTATSAFGTATTDGFATGIYTSPATSTQSAHKDSTALGLGLGLSIGLLSLAGGLVLGFWFIRERKKEKAAAQASQQQYPGGQPGMAQQQQQQPPVVVAPGAGPYKQPYKQPYNQPAELSQGAQYIGNEMPTHGGNTAEMAAPYHAQQQQAGYNPALQQQQQQQDAYIQPHPIHPQQQAQYYPQHGTPSPAPQVYHEVPAQHAGPGSPAPIPAHTPVQQHQHAPATGTGTGPTQIPGRSTTPNLYE